MCWKAPQPHDMDNALPSAIWAGRPSPTTRSRARARSISVSTRWTWSAPPNTPPKMPTSRCDCTSALYPQIRPKKAGCGLPRHRNAGHGEVLFSMERNGVLIDCDLARSAEPRTRRKNAGTRSQGARGGRASRSTSIRPSRSGNPVRQTGLTGEEKPRAARPPPTKRCSRSWRSIIRCPS